MLVDEINLLSKAFLPSIYQSGIFFCFSVGYYEYKSLKLFLNFIYVEWGFLLTFQRANLQIETSLLLKIYMVFF